MICWLVLNISRTLWKKNIKKFKQHPSIIAIIKHKPNKPNFSFSGVAKQSIESLIKTLDTSKTIQKDNIPTKIIEENMDIMSNMFHDNINKFFSESFFPDDLKRAEIIPIFKKDIKEDSKNLKEKIDQEAFYLIYLRFMKHVCATNYPVILKIFFHFISSAFTKLLVLNNA